ncbi:MULTISPECIES: M16 family metallopeptidase [unclassified Sphingomonas]|jgi:predicted Zn-dependent peptidase|uniref:M16 family metallopeptidase n=2 Tax=unclassified Sphingomonas TaxID=196159 RepID=UPI000835F06E|nr:MULTISPECIES: pitrilysin family protein [unclassified Sphingomonas]
MTRMRFLTPSLIAIATATVAQIAAPAAAQTAAAPKPAPVAQIARAIDIPYQEFTLRNGLRVIVHTDRKAPIVAVSVWYDVGSKHEPEGRTGFAHLFEHLMFNGTENVPGDFFDPLREIGATDVNGTTSFDRTNYFETVPRPALERALFLESDRMGYLLGAVTQELLDEQRGVVQNEKRQGDNQPYGLVRYKLSEGIYPPGHPYHHSVIGSMADLSAARLDDVKNWFRSYYGPNNAILVLAGDIDAAEARPLVEKYFGAIPSGPETVTPKITIPTLAEAKSEVIKDRVATTRIYRLWPVPGYKNADAVQLDIAASVLGGLASSRLETALVREDKLAVSAFAFNQSLTDAGSFGVGIDVRPGVDKAAAIARMDAVIADLVANGPTADEVQRVATNTLSGRLAGLEAVGGFGGKAVTLAQGALFAGDPAFYKKQLAALAAATPADVRAVMQKWLTRPAYTLTVEPGERENYVEATPVAKAAPAPAAAAAPVAKVDRGTRPEVGSIADLSFPKVERTKLSNGIELVYAQRTAVPVTQIAMSFDAGVAADPDGKLGTQSLTLGVMDEGTTTLNSLQLAEARERLGARITSDSSADRTTLQLYTPSANLAGSVALAADIVKNPAFAPAEVDRVRNQLLAGIQAELNNPQGVAQRVTPRLLFGDAHPYAKLAAGSGDPAAVAKLTRDDLVAFHRSWIRPDKAKFFIVSDQPLSAVKAALEAQFGGWSAPGAPGVKAFGVQPVQTKPKIVLIDRPNSPQSLIVGAQLTSLDPKSDLLPTLTSNEILGSGFLSRINLDLREAKGWSYGSRGGFGLNERAVSYVVNAPVQADKTGPAIESLQQVIGGFLNDKGTTKVEFDRTINGEIRELAGLYETGGAVLTAMQSNDRFGRPDNYYSTVAAEYRTLQPTQLDAAARAAIDPKNFVWVVVGDASKVRSQLDSIGLPVEVMPAAAAAMPATAGRPAK